MLCKDSKKVSTPSICSGYIVDMNKQGDLVNGFRNIL